MGARHRFRLTVLGRYPARLRENLPAVTVNLAAGMDGHFVHCGTLTMGEPEWEVFVEALRVGLGDALEVDE